FRGRSGPFCRRPVHSAPVPILSAADPSILPPPGPFCPVPYPFCRRPIRSAVAPVHSPDAPVRSPALRFAITPRFIATCPTRRRSSRAGQRSEVRRQVHSSRGLRLRRLPCELVGQDLWAFIPWPPALDEFGVEIHHPVFGNPGALVAEPLDIAVVTCGEPGEDLDDEEKGEDIVPLLERAASRSPVYEEVRLKHLILAQGDVGWGMENSSQPGTGKHSLEQFLQLVDGELMLR